MGSTKNCVTPVTLEDIVSAAKHVHAVIAPTPLTYSTVFSEIVGHRVYFKWENKQRTGSFKERGAISALSQLSEQQRKKGICAASAGNHALALSYHAARLAVPCTIVMPSAAPLVKVQSTQNTGAKVILHGSTFDEAYEYALTLAADNGLKFIPAFDDQFVIAGQGSCGLEIFEQLPELDSAIVPVGGGGLMAGIATALKAKKPDVYLLGVQSEWSVAARKRHAEGGPHPLLLPATIAEGIAMKRSGVITKPILNALVDHLVEASETNIARAVVRLLEIERTVVEGAGAAGVAALLAKQLPAHCKCTVVVLCGGNIDMNVLSRLIERDMGERGRLFKVEVSVPDRPGSLHAVTGIFAKTAANILQVIHNRSFSELPGNVDILFELEVRNAEHKGIIAQDLNQAGFEWRESGC